MLTVHSLMEKENQEDTRFDHHTVSVSPTPSASPVIQQHFVADRLPAIDMVRLENMSLNTTTNNDYDCFLCTAILNH